VNVVGSVVSDTDDYEFEQTASREEAAAVVAGVADGLLAGGVEVGEDGDAVTVAVPDEVDLEVEFEVEDGEVSLEVELEWPEPDGEAATADVEAADAGEPSGADETEGVGEAVGDAGSPDEGGDAVEAETSDADDTAETETTVAPVRAADASASLGRFEVFRDRGEEWRWRLRHRNGNVIATSGQGYTRKHNAWKGLRSVVRNAPGAAVDDEFPD
jgi:amphi-Trp domain-containing protein